MGMQLQGKRAVVTGSTAGIGFAIAVTLAREGAEVIVNGRTGARVDTARSGLHFNCRKSPGVARLLAP